MTDKGAAPKATAKQTPVKQKQQERKPSDWNLESPYDAPTTLQELIDLAPFKEASDSKGGTFTASTRVPTFIERKVIQFIEMKGSPYVLRSDVVRDALYLGMRVLHARYKGNPDFATEAKMSEAIGQVGVIAHMKEQAELLSKGLSALWAEGDKAQAVEGLEKYIAAVVEVKDDWQRSKRIQYIHDNDTLMRILAECSEQCRKAILEPE